MHWYKESIVTDDMNFVLSFYWNKDVCVIEQFDLMSRRLDCSLDALTILNSLTEKKKWKTKFVDPLFFWWGAKL